MFSFEERAKYVESIAKQHKDPVMFEEFAAFVFAPVLPQGVFSFLCSRNDVLKSQQSILQC